MEETLASSGKALGTGNMTGSWSSPLALFSERFLVLINGAMVYLQFPSTSLFRHRHHHRTHHRHRGLCPESAGINTQYWWQRPATHL